MDSSPSFTSVVVCTRNRGTSVVKTIHSLLVNQHPCFEVILIDQSTNQETEKAVDIFQQDSRFRYMRTTTQGVGRARNIGINESKGEVIIFTDDDCMVPVNWIELMADIFTEHPKVAVAFCNVVPAPHDPALGFIPSYIRKDEEVIKSVMQKSHARGIGAGMAVRKEAVQQFGGFDELLGPGALYPGCEEGDLALRAILKGWYVFETHRIAVEHAGFRTWQEGKALSKRNWVGIGAAYTKPIRSGYWDAWAIVLYEAFLTGLLQPMAMVFQLKRPNGVRNFVYFWQGFSKGWKHPIDKERIVFR